MADDTLGREWLARLQPGDLVIVRSVRAMGRTGAICKITKLTKTQIVIDRGNYTLRFRRDNGRECGGDCWSHQWLEEATPEACAVIRDERRRDAAIGVITSKIDWQKVPTEALELIVSIIKQHTEGGGAQ